MWRLMKNSFQQIYHQFIKIFIYFYLFNYCLEICSWSKSRFVCFLSALILFQNFGIKLSFFRVKFVRSNGNDLNEIVQTFYFGSFIKFAFRCIVACFSHGLKRSEQLFRKSISGELRYHRSVCADCNKQADAHVMDHASETRSVTLFAHKSSWILTFFRILQNNQPHAN